MRHSLSPLLFLLSAACLRKKCFSSGTQTFQTEKESFVSSSSQTLLDFYDSTSFMSELLDICRRSEKKKRKRELTMRFDVEDRQKADLHRVEMKSDFVLMQIIM